MITIKQIRNGKNYLKNHLSANDYYAEGEKVIGNWQGEGAKRLGLRGEVTEAQHRALCENRHPGTGEKLRQRASKVQFHDITISAPKCLSIAAIVGGDERLVEAFRKSVAKAVRNLETQAEVRVRAGAKYSTEATHRTGNVVAAVYHHDTSRTLCPQLHAHVVLGNLSYDAQRSGWFALQPKRMMEQSKIGVRGQIMDDLAKRIEKLGYRVQRSGEAFRIEGIGRDLERKFSVRAEQRHGFENRYRELFGVAPSKRRVEHFIKEGKSAARARFVREFEAEFGRRPHGYEVDSFVRDWRAQKLRRISSDAVRRHRLARLDKNQSQELASTVSNAYGRTGLAEGTVLQQSSGSELNLGVRTGKSLRRVNEVRTRGVAGSAGEETVVAAGTAKPGRRNRRVRLSRAEVMRRVRMGARLAGAIKGHPNAAIAWALRAQARRNT